MHINIYAYLTCHMYTLYGLFYMTWITFLYAILYAISRSIRDLKFGGNWFFTSEGYQWKVSKASAIFFFLGIYLFYWTCRKACVFLFYLYLGKRLSIKLNFKKYWRPWISEHEEITCSSLKTKLVSCPCYRQRNWASEVKYLFCLYKREEAVTLSQVVLCSQR